MQRRLINILLLDFNTLLTTFLFLCYRPNLVGFCFSGLSDFHNFFTLQTVSNIAFALQLNVLELVQLNLLIAVDVKELGTFAVSATTRSNAPCRGDRCFG